MTDHEPTRSELLDEVATLRQRVATLEAALVHDADTPCTERERALLEAAEFHRVVLENMPTPVFITDDTGAFTYVCPNVVHSLGYTADEVYALGNVTQLLGADLFDRAELDAGGELADIERVVRRKDGTERVFLIDVRRVTLRRGTVLYICHDITDHSLAERSLHALLNAVDDALFLMERDGTISIANEELGRRFDQTADALVGANVFDILPPDVAERRQSFTERVFETGEVATVEDQRGDRIVESRLYPVQAAGGQVLQVAIFGRDITAQRHAEQQLRRSEYQYRQLFEGALHPITVYDAGGIIRMINPVGARNLGTTVDGCIGRPLGDFIPGAQLALVERLRKILATGASLLVEDELSLPGGRRWFMSILQPLTLEDGDEDGTQLVQAVSYEISERKRAEDALRASEEKHRTLYNNLPIGVFRTAINGRLRDANPALVHLLGFETVDALRAAYSGRDLLGEETRRSLWAAHQANAIDDFELQLPRQDGSLIWVSLSARVVRDDGGQVLYYDGTLTDITARKRAEDALRESEGRYRALFEHAGLGIGYYTLDGVLVSFNTMAAQHMGGHPEDFAGRSVADIFGEEAGSIYLERIRQAAAAHTVLHYEDGVSLPDGERWFVSHYAPIADSQGAISGVQIIASDITARNRAEQQLRASEERYRTIYNKTPVMLHSIDRQGKLISVSDYWLAKLGYTRDEVLGRPSTDFLTDESRQRAREVELPAFFKSGQAIDAPYQMVTRSGDVLEVRMSAIAERDEAGEIVRSLAVTVDVTALKQAEGALRESEERARAQFQSIPVPTFVWQRQDDDFVLTGYNTAAEIATDGKVATIAGVKASDLYASRPDMLANVRRCLATGEVIHQATRYRLRSTGGEGFYNIYYAYVPPNTVLLHAADITALKQAEEERRESEERFRLLADVSFEAIAIHDAGVLLEANQQYYDMLGYTAEELLGQDALRMTVTPESLRVIREHMRAGRTGPYEIVGLRRDGTRFPLEVRARLMDYGGRQVRVAVLRDITDWKRNEAAERQQRKLAEALADTAAAISNTLDSERVLDRILANAGRVVVHQEALVLLVEDDTARVVRSRGYIERGLGEWVQTARYSLAEVPLFATMMTTQQPVVVPNAPADPRFVIFEVTRWIRSFVGTPIIIENEVVGFLNLYSDTPDSFTDTDAANLQAFAHHAAIALYNARLFEQVQAGVVQQRRLTRQVVLAHEDERQRVAHELHDDAGQLLTALRMSLQMLRGDLPPESELLARLDEIITLTHTTADQIRALAYGLRPPLLDTLGVNLALHGLCQDFADHTPLDIAYNGQEVADLPEVVAISLYRILQEALTNSARHAQAQHITVTLHDTAADVVLEVDDDGQGFDVAQVESSATSQGGLGLLGMRERAHLLDGSLVIESEPGQGTRIRVQVPKGDSHD